MRAETEIESAAIPKAEAVPRYRRLRQAVLRPSVCAVCASFGIFGGLASLFVGIVCVVLHAVVRSDSVFDGVGTVLLIAAMPMILIGSIFLDEINHKI